MYNLMTEDKKELTALGVLWAWAIVLAFIGSMFNVWINRPQSIRATECSLINEGVTDSWVATRTYATRSRMNEDGTLIDHNHSRITTVQYFYRDNLIRIVPNDQMDRVTCQPYVSP